MSEFAKYLVTTGRMVTGKNAGFRGVFNLVPDPGPGLTQGDLLTFLSLLEAGIPRETTKTGAKKDATQVTERVKAIKKIEDFVTDQRKQSVFANINKNVFAFQLALRARSPRRIDQGETTLCGPAALVYDVAKRVRQVT
jgi:hypothetical protein